MKRMRKVAESVIEAPLLARLDAGAAISYCDSIAHASDLWDGTLDDLAGYLRLMGSYVNGLMKMKEAMPENRDIMLKFREVMAEPIWKCLSCR